MNNRQKYEQWLGAKELFFGVFFSSVGCFSRIKWLKVKDLWKAGSHPLRKRRFCYLKFQAKILPKKYWLGVTSSGRRQLSWWKVQSRSVGDRQSQKEQTENKRDWNKENCHLKFSLLQYKINASNHRSKAYWFTELWKWDQSAKLLKQISHF